MKRRTKEDTVPLNLKQPPEWDRYLAAVSDEHHGYTHPYAGYEFERAWDEYREEHPVEEYANQILGAVGRRHVDPRKKNPRTREASGDGGGRTNVRVLEVVKDEITTYASEIDVPAHEVVRSVVCWYLDGGLLGNVTEKLEQAAQEVQAISTRTGGEEDESDNLVARRTRAICDVLTDEDGKAPGGFTVKEYAEAVKEGPKGLSDGYGDPAQEKYLPEVLGRMNFTEHPKNPELFVPEERAREFAEEQGIDLDGPAIDRLGYEDLSTEERVHGLRVEIARIAHKRGGKGSLNIDKVRERVFDEAPGRRTVGRLIDRAARAEGFDANSKRGQKRLLCNMEAVTDADVRAAIVPDDEGADGPQNASSEVRADPSKAMEALDSAASGRNNNGEDGGVGQ